jgi:hypothetical protein
VKDVAQTHEQPGRPLCENVQQVLSNDAGILEEPSLREINPVLYRFI